MQRKSPLIILFFVFISFLANAQTAGDYRSSGSGAWNVLSTWERYSGSAWLVPTALQGTPSSASNIITIQSGHIVSLSNALTVDQLTVSGQLNVSLASGDTLFVNNGAGTDLISTLTGNISIASGTIVVLKNGTATSNIGTIDNAGTINIGNSLAATTFTNTGTINNSGTIYNYSNSPNSFVNNSPAVVVNSGTINIGGAGFCKFNSGSTYKHNFPATNIATGVVPGATWDANSTFEMIACGNSGVAPSSINQNFGDFIWNYSTQPLDITFNAKLVSARDLIFRNTNGYSVSLRNTSTGSNTGVNRDFMVESNANVVLTKGDPYFSTSAHQVTVLGNYLQTGGTCTFTTSTGTGFSAGTGNATMNVTGNFTVSGGTLTLCASAANSPYCSAYLNVTGSFNVSGGTVNLNSSTTTGGGGISEVYVAGNFTHTGGVISKSSVNSASININGTTAQTIESIGFNSGDIIPFNINQTTATGQCSVAAAKIFVLNPGTTFTLIDNTSIAADFIINGTFTSNTNTWNLSSGVTQVASGGRFKNQSLTIGTNTLTSLSILSGGYFQQNVDGGIIPTATFNSGSILEVTGIVSATVLNGGGQSFGRIDWNSPSQTVSTVFGASGFATKNDYTITSTGLGAVLFPDVDFTLGTTSPITALSLLGTSKLQVSAGTNLFATGNRTVTLNGNVSVAGTAQIIVGSPNTGAAIGAADLSKDIIFLLKKNFVYSSTTPIIAFDHKSYAAFGDESYRLVLNFNGTAAQTCTIAAQASNMITLSGDGTPNSGTDDEFISNNPYQIIASSTNTVSLGANVKYKSLQVNSGCTLNTSTFNLIHYSLLTASGAIDNPATTVSGTLNMNLSTLTDASGTGVFTLNSLGTLITKHTGGIAASGATGCIQTTGARTYNSNANYTYNGTAAQITGTGLPTTLTGTLTIANTLALLTGGVTLTQATAIQGVSGTRQLTLTTGRLITTAVNLLTIGDGSVVSPAGGSATSFVHGPIKKVGFTSGNEFVFPTGKINKWARISLTPSSTSATAAFTAEYFNTAYASLTPLDASLDHVSSIEYWDLARNIAGTDGKVKLYWESTTGSGITSTASSDLRVAHWYNPGAGLKWYAEGTSPLITVSGATGTIQTDIDVTSFSPFTFGAPNGVNPLPIELIDFKGFAEKSGNVLQWTTATEINNDYFSLERSTNGYEFAPIATIDGTGNSSSIKNYEFTDENISEDIYYYRLKQVDFDGRYSYSNIVSVERKQTSTSFIDVYPNPSTTGIINILTSEDVTEIVIYNAIGQVVRKINTLATSNYIQDINIAEGVYIIKALISDNSILTTRIVVSK